MSVRLNEEEERLSILEGYKIFDDLIKKYTLARVSGVDINLNILCWALARLGKSCIQPKDYEKFSQAAKETLLKNLFELKRNG